MVDIRVIEANSQTEALALARLEHGVNFTILGSKDVSSKGILGIGARKKTQLRIMLQDSIYESRKTYETPTTYEAIEDNSHSEDNEASQKTTKHYLANTHTLNGTEIGERVVAITKILQDAAKERAIQASNNQHIESTKPIKVSLDEMKKINVLSETHKNDDAQIDIDIDKKVEEIVSSKIKDFMKEYSQMRLVDKNTSNNEKRKNYSSIRKNRNLKDYLEKNIAKSHECYNINTNKKEVKKPSSRDRNIGHENNDYTLSNKNASDKKLSLAKKEAKKEVKNTKLKLNDGLEKSISFLRDCEFPPVVIKEIKSYLLKESNARFVQSPKVIQNEITEYFSKNLKLLNGIEINTAKKKIIILVGPTGVGKTTTIAKIAASFLENGKNVSFVTIDNYRIAAADQLNKYADIMNIPFAQASSPEALRAQIRKMESNSILFVDTMGRSPKAQDDIIELSKYFSATGRFDVDIELVMSATVKYNDGLNIINSFKPTNYNGLILTKLDETDYLASSISSIYKAQIPITYATFGQKVPRDIVTGIEARENILNGLYGK